MKIEIIKSDFGYQYVFNLKEPDGTASDLSNATAKLRAKHSEDPEIIIEKSITPGSSGQCTYTLGASDFTKEGVYYAEVEVTKQDNAIITYQGFTIVVLPKV